MNERSHQEASDNLPEWVLSPESVTELFDTWPVPKIEAFAALEGKTDIARSWFMALEGRLVSEGVISEIRVPKEGNKIAKKLDAHGVYLIGLLAQGLRDQKLLYIESPKRNYAITEMVEVMRVEKDNLC